MNPVLAADEPDRREHLDADTPCVSCGYNLRGLAPDGKCPECGVPVRHSLRGNLLRLGEPRWVVRLHRGAVLLFCGTVILTVMWLFGMAVYYSQMGFVADLMTVVRVPAKFVNGAGLAASCLGVWLLTTPDPQERLSSGGRWIRMACRGGLSVVLIVYGLHMGARQLSWTLAWGTYIVLPLVVMVWAGTLFLHIGRLAERLPSRPLRRMTRWCLVGLGSYLLHTANSLLMLVAWAIGGPGAVPRTGNWLTDLSSGNPLAIASCIGEMVGIVWWGLLYVLASMLLWRCRRLFREAAREAKQRGSSVPAVAGAPA